MNDFTKRLTVALLCVASVPVSIFCISIAKGNYHGYAPVGTYQVISEKSADVSFPQNYMDSLRIVIQNSRDSEKEVLLEISPEAHVRILPKREISLAEFHPVAEFVFVDKKVQRIKNR
ncbi:hypothetical protein BH09BAC5_BH09BAC5_08360 [soil metagenome]